MSVNDTHPDAGSAPTGVARRRNVFVRYFSRFDEGEVIRCAFHGLLIGAVTVIGLDVHELWQSRAQAPLLPGQQVAAPAVLPPAVNGTGSGDGAGTIDPRGNLTADEAALREPLTFTLEAGGVLEARGYIDAGSRSRLEAELGARGEYVKTVSLNSPGGALDDAIGMAQMIRERGLSTEVRDGALCASSCPLVLAGGESRIIGEKAAVGVHQFYSVSTEPSEPAQAMSDAQATTARISRHLAAMGVDPALWLHALDTPPRSLYYLSPEQLRSYRLVTGGGQVASR